jgi:hypothetical protein
LAFKLAGTLDCCFLFFGLERSGFNDAINFLVPTAATLDWSIAYSPTAANGKGQITVMLVKQSAALDLPPGHRTQGAQFNRFGIISNWVDGNGQVVFLDDLIYTARQK